MDELRRRRDDEVIERLFEKLDKISETQIKHGDYIERINRTLYVNNGETCMCTKLDDLSTSVEQLKNQRNTMVTTAQALWVIVGFFVTAGMGTLGLLLTLKQLGWLK